MTIEIKNAESNDLADITEIAAATFALACPEDSAADEIQAYISNHLSINVFRDLLNSNTVHITCAFSNNKMAGFAIIDAPCPCTEHPDLNANGNLQKLYVLPEFHGTGAAKALMDDALTRLRSSGSSRAWLSVYSDNARAKAFYAKFGFAVAGDIAFIMGSEVHLDCIMVADIP